MINQFDIDGSGIADIINDIVSEITTTLLEILVGIFSVILNWFVDLFAFTYFDNPAIILIALIFYITAWRVSESG